MNESSSDFIQSYLPSAGPSEALHLRKSDAFIHAPGFEDRTMAIPERLIVSAGARGILLDYRPANVDNRLGRVRAALRDRGLTLADEDVLTYHRFIPDDFESRLRTRLIGFGATRVAVDISTMSKLAILLILGVCRDLDLDVTIAYASAEKYGPSKEEFENAKKNNEIHQPTIQIFTGVHGVVRVGSLASVSMQGQPTAAIVFMSFNDALTQVLLNTVYPSRLFLVNGRPPVLSWREEATAWIHDQVRREWAEDNQVCTREGMSFPVPCRAVSTFDYRETVSLLITLYWQLSATHRLILAPAGSKMQAVGCFLAKALHPDIHVEYPSPESFLPEYSSGIADRWVLHLGKFSRLTELLSNQERREFLEIPS